MPSRKVYEEQLQELNKRIIEMGHEAEEMISNTLQSLINGDHVLAQKVIDSDDKVDLLQLEIEKECAILIAHQQPIARDLRFILSVVKIVTDIERIADQCCDICKYSIKLQEDKWSEEVNYQRHIEKMAIAAKDMLTGALNTFATKNIEDIKDICKADDKIDEAFWKVWKEIRDEMMADKTFIKSGLHYIMIIKYLERIADHITNIAEWIYYSLTGEYVIHASIKDIEIK